MTSRSSSVSLPHCSFTLPLTCFQLPSTRFQSIFITPFFDITFTQTRSQIMSEKDLSDLFVDTLKDIYYAEKQIYKSLPKMVKAAASDQLREAFEKHHDETEGQIERLEKIFELLGKPARGKKCA